MPVIVNGSCIAKKKWPENWTAFGDRFKCRVAVDCAAFGSGLLP